MASKYVFDKKRGTFVDRVTRKPMLTDEQWAGPIEVPMTTIRDIEPYIAPSGAYIPSRAHMRDDDRAHGYVPYERVNTCPVDVKDPAERKAAQSEWLSKQQKRYLDGADRIT